jgi:hypothetical protein
MAKYIFVFLVLSLFFVGHASADSDSVVAEDGDIRINGLGNGLVFPDGTKQQSAAAVSLVIQHVSSDNQVSFPNGQTSPAVTTCLYCPQGMVALGGGGVQTSGGVGFVFMNASSPTSNSTGWCVTWVASLQSSQTNNVQTQVTCVQSAL